jgi:polyhydroxyalkanoate synthase subunit PhaC
MVQRNTHCCAAEVAALIRDTPKSGPHPLAAHVAASWQAALGLPDPAAAMAQFHAGLATYQAHPYARNLAEMPELARIGNIRLLDYGPATGAPLLVIPSLINPATVLDLSSHTSLLRWLKAQGIRPLLVDWGVPGAVEAGFSIDDYVTRALLPLLTCLNQPVAVMGYCLGGTLAVALAALAPARVTALALLAAPWDMYGYDADQRQRVRALWADWQPRAELLGALPMEMLQLLFLSLDPALTLAKFTKLAGLDSTSAAAQDFVALEDWANSGPPLALPAGTQLFDHWYQSGGPAHGWRIHDVAIKATPHPALIVISSTDRIVPATAAQPLADQWPGARCLHVPAGHVGMVVGSRRQGLLWEPLRDFLYAATTEVIAPHRPAA